MTYVPTDDKIKVLMDYLKEYDYDMHVACSLVAFGTMRRSEICALTAKDVSSTRDTEIPEFVINLLPKEGSFQKNILI